MTATMTETELDVEYVLWEAEDPLNRPCEAQRIDCPNVALYYMLWRPAVIPAGSQDFSCNCGKQPLCLGCKDWVLAQPGASTEPFVCNHCDGLAALKGIEPISRG